MRTATRMIDRLFAIVLCLTAVPLIARTHTGGERNYLQATSVAMATMMRGMEVIPSGDVDQDFVEGMTAHHQGAIDMAEAVLQYGSNPRLKRIAQEIIITQEQEKVAMRRALTHSPGSEAPLESP